MYKEKLEVTINHILQVGFESYLTNMQEETKKKLNNYSNIIICGNLPYTRPYANYLRKKGCNVFYMDFQVDTGLVFPGKGEKYPIVSINDVALRMDMRQTLFVIASRSGIESYRMVIKKIFACENIIYYGELLNCLYPIEEISKRNVYTYSGIKSAMQSIIDGRQFFFELMENMEDEISKELLARILLFRMTFDLTICDGIKDKYIDYLDEDVIKLGDNEIIVDAGGYVGDTLYNFKRFFENKKVENYEYYLFEPVSELLEQAKLVAQDERVHYCMCGLSNCNTKINLKDNNITGVLSPVTTVTEREIGTEGELVRLDDYIKNKAVTYIKMDIEGEELKALEGATETIKKYKPRLAICLYHKFEDIEEICGWIMKLNMDYRYYIRAQRNSVVTEYILYAI